MNWAEIIGAGLGALASLGGAFALGRYVQGRPPAARAKWDEIDARAKAVREAREREARP